MNLRSSIQVKDTLAEHGDIFALDTNDTWHLTHLDGRFSASLLESFIAMAEQVVSDNLEWANSWISQITRDLEAMCIPGWQLKRDTLMVDTTAASALLMDPDYKKISPAANQLNQAVATAKAMAIQTRFV